jgi:hypothetical protein
MCTESFKLPMFLNEVRFWKIRFFFQNYTSLAKSKDTALTFKSLRFLYLNQLAIHYMNI